MVQVADNSDLPRIEVFVPDPAWPKPGRYKHKSGGYYTLIQVALNKETEEPWVYYRCEQPVRGRPEQTPWVCPLAEWTEVVEWPDGSMASRYVRVGGG